MGGGISSLFKRFLGNKETRLLCIGLDDSGKTTLLYKLKIADIEKTTPTIGYNVESLQYKNTSVFSWDLGGRTNMRSLWRHYFTGVQGIIFTIDSNDRERILDAKNEMYKFLSEEGVKDAALLVFANKQDLPNAMSLEEIIEKLELNSIKNRKWFIQSSCATSGQGLYEGMDWLSKAILNKEVLKFTKSLANPLSA